MIQGSKHYFTFFGIMIESINVDICRFFSQIRALFAHIVPIEVKLLQTIKHNLQKHQTYQG